MKRLCLLLLAAAAFSGLATSAQAETWLFSRSYYSHDPVTQVRIAEPVVRGGPYYTRPQGVYVRSGFRNSNSIINMGRAGTDQTNIWESWIQTGAQF